MIIPGIVLGAAAILFSFFIPRTIAQFKLAFLIGGVISVLTFTYFAGKQSESIRWETKEKDLQVEMAILKATSAEVETIIVTEFVTKVKEIEKIRVEYETVYVPQFITKEADSACTLTNGFTRVHDSAAKNVVPGTPEATDADPSGIALSAAAATIATNYLTCHQIREQLISLQDWVSKQRELAENGRFP